MSKEKRRTATLTEMFAIRDKLALVVRKVGENGCEYIDSHITDQTVARDLNTPLGAVQRIRRDQYGDLRGASGGPGIALKIGFSELSERCDRYEQQLTEAARQIGALQHSLDDIRERFNKLVLKLSVENIAPDIRHLVDQASYKNGPPPQVTRR